MYARGLGVELDDGIAVEWFEEVRKRRKRREERYTHKKREQQ